MSRWCALTEENLKENDAGPGMYFIRAISRSGKPRSLPRLLGRDIEGLLYIGKTGEGVNAGLDWRIWCFWREAIGRKQAAHVGGARFRRVLSGRFPISSLEYRYRRLRSRERADQEETLALERYQRRFGELPPLNRQG